MGITYKPLLNLLKEKGISKTQLADMVAISSSTMAKISKDEYVSMKVVESICKVLKCQPSDIFAIISDKHRNELLEVLLEEKEMKLKGCIYHETQIQFAYNSNHIEGSRLSQDQTRYIYEYNTLLPNGEAARIDDIMEAINHFQCFDYILSVVDAELSEDIIKKIHCILKTNTSDSRKTWFNVGEYKSKPNIIGNRETTAPDKVKIEIGILLKEYNNIVDVTFNDIIDFHYRFESIHPFQDGNGRVGRLIMFKECLKHNIIPFIIEDDIKAFYYRGFKEYADDSGYLRETCLSAQDKYQEFMKYFFSE